MSLASQIARNTLYQIFSKVFVAAAGLIMVALMTRYLGQTGFGYYTTIVAFLQFFGVLADFGLQMTATQMISKPGADEKKIFNNAFALRFCSALIFLGSAAIISWFLPYPSIVKIGITITTLSFLFNSLQSIIISLFQKHLNMALVAVAEIWGKGTMVLGIWLMIALDQGLLFIMVAFIGGNFINFLILFFYSFKYLRVSFEFDWKIWRKIWQTAWPLAITVALTLVYFRADTLIMSFFRPPSEVGLYGAAYKVIEVLIQFPYLFLGLVLPILTKFFVVDRKLFQATIQKSFDFMLMIIIPMILGGLILGEKIMTFVAGGDFLISGEILRVLIFAVGAIYLGALFGYGIVACELQKKMIKFYIFNAAISVVLYLLLIPHYTYWAAAAVTVLTEVTIAAAAFYTLRKHTQITIKLKMAGKVIAASAVMAVVLLMTQNQHVIAAVILGIIVYGFALYLVRGIDKKMLMEVIKYK